MKPELVVVAGPHRGLTVTLESNKELYIGRSSSADVCLHDDKKVSQLHAKILPVGPREFILEDLGSTNGTYVNGKQMEQTPVQSGDRLKIGRTLFVYRTDAEVINPSDFHINEEEEYESAGDHVKKVMAEQLQLLSRIFAAISRNDNGRVALSECMEVICRAIHARRGIAFLRDPMSATTQQIATVIPAGFNDLPMQPTVLQEVARRQRYSPPSPNTGGAVAVPLKICGVVSGALYFDSPNDERPPVDGEAEFLEALGHAFSQALTKDKQARLAETAAEVFELLSLGGPRSPMDSKAIIEDCVDLYMDLAKARKVQLTTELGVGLYVAADDMLIRRAFERLCEHVITLSTGSVHIMTRQGGSKETQITLSYSGRGFDAQGLSHVFHVGGVGDDFRFAQEHGLDGTLAFCRAAVELGGGELTVSSPGPESGAVFMMTLPSEMKSTGFRKKMGSLRRSTEKYF